MNLLSKARGVRIVLGLAVTAMLVAACGGSTSSNTGGGTKTPFTIAFITDLTGGNSGNSIGGQAGFNTAVKEINDAGGANGHKLQVQTYDSQSDVNTYQAQLRQALGTNPSAIAGQWLSSSTAAAASVIGSANVPVVTASYTVTGVNTVPYWFSTSPLASGVGAGVVNGLKGLLGGSLSGKKIGFEGLISPAVDGNLAAIKSQVESNGGSMSQVIRDPVTFSSWSSQAANMVAAKPDAVITNNTDTSTSIVTKALGVAGFNGPIMSTEGANSDVLLKSANSPNVYVVRETVVPATDAKLYKDAIAAGATPDQIAQSYFGKVYAAAYIISNTLAKCGDTCPATKFTSTLQGLGKFPIPNNALAGPVDFSKSQSGLTTAQVFTWDATNGKSIPKGSTFSIVV